MVSSMHHYYYVYEKDQREENFLFRIHFQIRFLSVCVNIPLTALFVSSSIPFDPLFFVSAFSCLLFKGACTQNESELESEHFL